MSFADLLVVLISVPFASTIYITSTWPFGLVLCKFNAMLQDISIGVSIFTLLILSIDRYTAIVTPFKLHNKRSTRGCAPAIKIKIVAIWIVSILCSLPDAINTTLEEIMMADGLNYHACSPYPNQLGIEYHITLVLCKFFVYFVIPVSLITVAYGLMARQLLSSADFLPSSAPGNQQNLQKQMKTRKSLAKLFLVMVLLFVLCFLPKHIFLIWFYGDPNSMDHYNLGWHIFKLISHCLAYVNSCINPVTLYFLSKVFRRYFNRIMCYACGRCIPGKSADNEEKDWFRRPSHTMHTSMPDVSGYALENRRRSENASFHNNLNITISKNNSLSPLPVYNNT
ncbi:neuropeptide CCHamide-1 receptor-like isoform X2 [Paramacrobiotus metropolitanus]|nr:neuropeptide CCHamide-1 receptor-like isoform X2 [Paramacrobiotus metropolitanus]